MAQAGIGQGRAEGAIVRAASLVAVPWANGGGVTRVMVDRLGAFRLSLATIDGAGPFSRFPGVLRQFALVAGRVDLSGPAPFPVSLDALSPPVTFGGDVPVHAVPRGGAALALNLMVPDGAPRLRLVRGKGLLDAVAIFACGPVTVDGVPLGAHDCMLVDVRVQVLGPVQVSGPALVVLR